MKAIDVFNIAIHLERIDLIKSNILIKERLEQNKEKKKKPILTEKEAFEYIIQRFSKKSI